MKKLLKNNLIKNYLVFMFFLFLLEVIFRVVSGITLKSTALLRIFLGVNFLSVILSYILSWFNKKVSKYLILIISFLATIYAFVQIGFNNFIGVYASVNASSQLGAVTSYIVDFFSSYKLTYYLILVPFILLILYFIFLDKFTEYKNTKKFPLKYNIMFGPGIRTIISSLVLIFLGGLYYGSLEVNFMQNKLQTISNKNLFKYPSVPSIAVNQFGILGFGILDASTIFGNTKQDNYVYAYEKKEEDEEKSRVVDDSAFDYIIENEKNDVLNNINKYLKNNTLTDYNDHTGMFEGKNVIVIMMESVGDMIINEEYFPNFYKMYSEGIRFQNNYSPRNSCATINNEFSGMTGLYTIQNDCTANTYSKNTYFTSIFNLFKNKGYKTSSMHDYTEQFYLRSIIHKNMGSDAYYGVQDLGIAYSNVYQEWASDEDFMEVAMDKTLKDTSSPFMLWLTTVSPHQPYNQSSIEGDKYLDMTENMNYSIEVRRYLSKLKTFDNSLGILLRRLKEANILKDTVIVLYGDHYPYGLKDKDISTVIDYDLDDYEIERTPMVIYNSDSKSEVVEKYSSYLNLTPTIANLFNLDYDPRLYMGADVFSDEYLDVVAFADGSWKNSDVYYDAGKAEVKYLKDIEIDMDELIKINNIVSNRMQISTSIIRNNYYKYLENKIKKYEEMIEKENENEESSDSGITSKMQNN